MKALFAWIAILIAGQTTPAARVTIEGVVLRQGSNEPIVEAQLTVSRQDGQKTISSVLTEASGRFLIKDLDAGAYKLTAAANGYARQGMPLVLTGGENLKDITFHLTPAGNVSGHVFSATGRPLAGIPVYLVRSIYDADGNRSTKSEGAEAWTDDRGEYRFYWIRPGRYFVVAGQGESSIMYSRNDGKPTNEVVDRYPYAFFPRAASLDRAEPIEITPGGETGPIDLTLGPSRFYTARARVIDLPIGPAAGGATVFVSYWTPDGMESTGSASMYNPKTGMLELNNMAPGTYDVVVIVDAASAAARFVIVDQDVEGEPMTLTGRSVISGRVSADVALPEKSLTSLQILFLPPKGGEPAFIRRPVARPRADGTFSANVPYGEAQVQVAVGDLAGFYVKSARLDGADVLGKPAKVPRTGALEIVLSSKGGRIDGVVEDAQSHAVSGAQVVLVPTADRDRPGLFKSAITDRSGHYAFSDIPPGEYKVFAWDAIEPYAWLDPEILEPFEEAGKPVTVRESSTHNLTIPVISQEGGK